MSNIKTINQAGEVQVSGCLLNHRGCGARQACNIKVTHQNSRSLKLTAYPHVYQCIQSIQSYFNVHFVARYQVVRILLNQWRRYKPLLLSQHGDCKHSRYVRQLAFEPLLWLSQNWHAWFNVKYTRCLARTPHSWSCPGENPRLSSPSMLRAVFQVKMLFFYMMHLFQYRITSFIRPISIVWQWQLEPIVRIS
jgi:hypothetical protein